MAPQTFLQRKKRPKALFSGRAAARGRCVLFSRLFGRLFLRLFGPGFFTRFGCLSLFERLTVGLGLYVVLKIHVAENRFRRFRRHGGSLGLPGSRRLHQAGSFDQHAQSLVHGLGILKVIGQIGIQLHDARLGEVGSFGKAARFKRTGARSRAHAEFLTAARSAEARRRTAVAAEAAAVAAELAAAFLTALAEGTAIAEIALGAEVAAVARFAAIPELTAVAAVLTAAETAFVAFAAIGEAAAFTTVGAKGSPMRAVVLPRFAIHETLDKKCPEDRDHAGVRGSEKDCRTAPLKRIACACIRAASF